MKRIIVGVNDPRRAAELVDWTAHLSHELHAPVTIVHAIHRSEMWLVASMQLDCTAYVHDYRVGLAHHVLAPLAARRTTAAVHIAFGDPARVLANLAQHGDAGLILVGASSHQPIAGMLADNVSRHLEHLVKIPLVVVPASCRAAA